MLMNSTITDEALGSGEYGVVCRVLIPLDVLKDTYNDFVNLIDRYSNLSIPKEHIDVMFSSLISEAIIACDSEFIHTYMNKQNRSATEYIDTISTYLEESYSDIIIDMDIEEHIHVMLLEIMILVWDIVGEHIKQDRVKFVVEIPFMTIPGNELIMTYNGVIVNRLNNSNAGHLTYEYNVSIMAEFIILSSNLLDIN